MDDFCAEVNEILKDDWNNVEKFSHLKDKLQENLEQINEQVDEQIYLNEIVALKNRLDDKETKFKEFRGKLNSYLYENQEFRTKVNDYCYRLERNYSTVYYLMVVQNIQITNHKFNKSLENEEHLNSVKQLEYMCEIRELLHLFMYKNLEEKLSLLIKRNIEMVEEKYTNLFQKLLSDMQWPYVTNIEPPIHDNQIDDLKLTAKLLLKIELLEQKSNLVATKDPSIPNLVVKLLSDPFKKRFFYHFYGKKMTNSIDHPEWYLTQTLNWIRSHLKFVHDWIEPIFIEEERFEGRSARLQFARELVRLGVDKFNTDITKIVENVSLFNHYIDEALDFDSDLMKIIRYPSSEINIYHVLNRENIVDRWISMERKSAFETMDSILCDEKALDLLNDQDDVKVTKCADAFVSLLYLLTARYEKISKPYFKLKFLDLQLELLDDFRIRLIQLSNVESDNVKHSKLLFILNTIDFIENILNEWGSNLHFINLHEQKKQRKEMETNESVFDEILKLYKIMSSEILNNVINEIMRKIRAKCHGYCRERWSNPVSFNVNPKNRMLTASACDFFQILLTNLHVFKEQLSCELFELTWRMIAKQLDTFLFTELILSNKFSSEGAQQLKFDIFRNLFPIFYKFTKKSENYFPLLKESILLLNLSGEDAIELKKVLSVVPNYSDFSELELKKIGVHRLKPKSAVNVLNSRKDVFIYFQSNN